MNESIYVRGRARNNFEAGLTPMAYAKAVFSSSAFGENGDNAMAALYYYHVAAQQQDS